MILLYTMRHQHRIFMYSVGSQRLTGILLFCCIFSYFIALGGLGKSQTILSSMRPREFRRPSCSIGETRFLLLRPRAPDVKERNNLDHFSLKRIYKSMGLMRKSISKLRSRPLKLLFSSTHYFFTFREHSRSSTFRGDEPKF